MQLVLGVLTFVGGATLLYVANRDRDVVPPWVMRLALGLTALGLSTLTRTQDGVAWSISSICFSLIAIVLLASVILEVLRRRR
ncbi:MAG TPA: hypothetical protein VMM77_00325 [Gemmatimonadaceae bacterium]|nr:hypothetical protein [Gemmatimonadaceae bacterium]